MQSPENVYLVGTGLSHPDVTPDEVGGKAYHLMQMDRMRLPVPPALVLSTGFCRNYFEAGRRLPDDFTERLRGHVRTLEARMDRTFGGRRRPLLVSVRSGAPVSMPGMMETILNVGLTDQSLQGLVRMTGNPRLAWDAYRRLVQYFAEVVHGVPATLFEERARERLSRNGLSALRELSTAALRDLAADNLAIFREHVGDRFPQDAELQLTQAVEAVFRSWDSAKARAYRRVNGIDKALGTAVTVQSMVFGNAGGTSGAGVAFTRNPATGDRGLYLDFAFDAQGEDVVSGRATAASDVSLQKALPDVCAQLERISVTLEQAFRDLQDFEFTVEQGHLYLLQTRAGKRTPWAALRIAVDMVQEGLIGSDEGMKRLSSYDLDDLQRPRLCAAGVEADAHGIAASSGVGVGRMALSLERAAEMAGAGEPVALVRNDMVTDDIEGLATAEAIVTVRGGRLSHAAVVARQLGKACVVQCANLSVEPAAGKAVLGGQVVREGEWLSVDGESGEVYAAKLEVRSDRPDELLAVVADWRRV